MSTFTYNGHLYLLGTAGIWTAAQTDAQSRGGNLTTVNNQAENDWLAATFSQGSNIYWLGYTDQTTEGTWAWINGETDSYSHWHSGEPNNFGGNEDYAEMAGDGQWNDASSTKTHQGIVELSGLYTYNGHSYLLSTAGSWSVAQTQATNLGGHLVSISSPAEQTWLNSTFGGTGNNRWIGFTDETTEGTWQWISGQPTGYTNWAAGEPNNGGTGEDYAAMLSNGKWNDTTGTASYQGIIELNANPSLTSFASTVASGNEDNEISIALADLTAQGDESDEATISTFVVKAVSTGSLKIGSDVVTATAYASGSNDTIDGSHNAYWTPDSNANGTLNAFTVVAKDAEGLESATAIQATVDVTAVNDAPTGLVNISGTATQGQTLTASNTLADADGLGTQSYQWFAGNVAISGATASTYTLTLTEVAKTMSVTASYTDSASTLESVSSSATTTVLEAISIVQSDGSSAVTEGGSSDSYTVALNAPPTADVTINLGNTNQQVTSDVSSLVFTSSNWNTPQTVTVSAVNDTVGENKHTGVIQHSVNTTDTAFQAVTPNPIVVSITDNDLPARDPVFDSQSSMPFGLSNVGIFVKPDLVDINADGDLDLFVGAYNGNLYYFDNSGTASSPSFTTVTSNPFGLSNIGSNFADPDFADIDADGDLDAFVGAQHGDTLFFENTGSATSPSFSVVSSNPFGLTNLGHDGPSPCLVDINADGDLDAFFGYVEGDFKFFENTGTTSNPEFAALTINPYGLTDVGASSKPTFVDLDADGDFDAVAGGQNGDILVYQNTGTASSPAFSAPTTNPYNFSNNGSYSHPTLGDLNADGDWDALVSYATGDMVFFDNNARPTLSSFASEVASGNEDNEISVSFAELQSQGDEADVDGTVTAFVIKEISSGSLKIGVDAASAVAYAAGTNDVVDATHNLYWTPAANANGTLNAFTVVTKDAEGLESATAVQTTMSVTAVNDAPTLSATGATVIYSEDSSAVDLFSAVTAATIDDNQTFSDMTVTVTNVADASEYLTIAGTDVALTDGASGTMTDIGNFSVSKADTTATITLSAMTLTDAQMATLIDGISYYNSSQTPDTASNRVVTITNMTDSGSDNNSASPTIAATVSLDSIADITSVDIANGTRGENHNYYRIGDVITVTANFDQAVSVALATPTLAVDVGGDSKTASYVSGSGTTALVFQYTVQTGDVDSDGVSATANGMTLGAATLQDTVGIADNATLSYDLVSNVNAIVDGVAPTLSSIAVQNPATASTNADTLVYRVTFDEEVTNVGINDFSVSGGSTATVSNIVAISPYRVFDVTVSGGDLADFNGTVTLGFSNSQYIPDRYAGNPLVTPVDTAAYSVDNLAPTVSAFSSSTADGSYRVGDTIGITATLSESVQSGSTFVATLDTGAAITLTAASAGTSLTGTYTVGVGDTSSDLTVSSFSADAVTDTAGNAMTDTTVPSGTDNIAGSKAIVINDLPTLTGKATVTVTAETASSISGFTVVDNDSATVTVKIVANHGSLSIGDNNGITEISLGATLEFSGSVADVNTALNKLSYVGDSGYHGTDSLTLTVSDDGGSTWQPYTVNTTDTVFNATNGHYYERVWLSGIDLNTANTAANAKTLYGLNGYLATVSSATEQSFLTTAFGSNTGGSLWLGASDAAVEGEWQWISGPEAGTQFYAGQYPTGTTLSGQYSNWSSGEPNNSGNEDYVQTAGTIWQWNDHSTLGDSAVGYLCEYGGTGFGGSIPTAANLTVTVDILPTLTTFTSAVASGNEDTEIPITFSELQSQGDEADVDGTVTAFTIKAVSNGTLKIGTDTTSATAYAAGTNDVVDATHNLYWTPAANANGVLNAFTAVAKDNDGLESTTAVQASVTVAAVNDTPVLEPTITSVAATDAGWYKNTGDHTASNSNYFVGDSNVSNSNSYRNWLSFTLPTLSSVFSAQLQLKTYQFSSGDASETYELREVTTPVATLTAGGSGLTTIYDDLGDGALYGSRDFSSADNNQTVTMDLNSDLLSALVNNNGLAFAMGGSLTTLDAIDNTEYIFGSSSSSTTSVQLLIQTSGLNYTENQSANAVHSNITITDVDNTSLSTATVSITSNFQAGEDVLSFVNDGLTMGNISASYATGTGVLSLLSAGASATLTEWQAALRAITYSNSSDNPSTLMRTVSYQINDNSTDSTAIQAAVKVTAVNDPPVVAIPLTNQAATTNVAFNYSVAANSFTDVDDNTLTYTTTLADGSALPAWLSFNATTQTFSGTPDAAGNLSVKVTATDTANASVSSNFTLDVTATATPYDNHLTDFDGNGKSDLLWTHSDGSVYAMTLNDINIASGGLLYDATATSNGAWQVLGSKGDYDGDAKTDLLLWNSSTSSAYLAQMNGASIATQGGIDYAQNITGWTIADSSADYNNDGKSDILWWNSSTSTIYLALQDGSALLSGGALFENINGWAIQSAGGDYNGDGNSDMLLWNSTTGSAYMATMNGLTMTSQEYVVQNLPSDWAIVDAKADYNGDGNSDILWRNSSTGELWEYQMDGAAISNDAHVATIDTAYQVLSAHNDFNGDGKADILWKNTSDGSAWISLVDGNGITSSVSLGSYADWTVQNADNDVNGDGKADVLWTNTDGSTYVMEMDGVSIIGGGTLGPYSGWEIMA